MPGVGRTAVSVTAFLLCSAAWATAEAPSPQQAHVLPKGTAVVFISDGRLDSGARAGSSVTVHLRDPLVLDGLVVAAVGAKARLVVGDLDPASGKPGKTLVLEHFETNPGLLPVALSRPAPHAVESGSIVDCTTLATVARVGDRLSIETPFPFRLGNETPLSAYTPTPARTANPHPTRAPLPAPKGAIPTSTPPFPSGDTEPTPLATLPGQSTPPPR